MAGPGDLRNHLFRTALPIKIWNSKRNEKKLEQQQLRLNEARLAALSQPDQSAFSV